MHNDAINNLGPLRQIIQAHDLSPKKSLGQNFLLDLNLTRKIAKVAGNLDSYTIIEIGPGPGGLTRSLFLEGAKSVIAIEQDERALSALQSLVQATKGNLHLINGDALTYDYRSIASKPCKILANLPYNISTVLLINWLKQAELFASLTLMFQKEVADRLYAEPGTSSYGRLSVMSQWRCKVRKCFHIPPSAFIPPPKVTSTVVHLEPKPIGELTESFEAMETVTKAAFGQRRKMLRTSLKSLWADRTEIKLKELNLDPQARAERLTVKDYTLLARNL